MGYRGKLEERVRARELRARSWTLQEIADELGVAKSSVSRWVRDVEVDLDARRSARTGRRPRGSDHPLRRRKLAEIAAADRRGRQRLARLSERDLLIAGVALYAGEGAKTDGLVKFANADAELMRLFCAWPPGDHGARTRPSGCRHPGPRRHRPSRGGLGRWELRGWDSNPQTSRLTADCSAS
jgi:hypothetical protein